MKPSSCKQKGRRLQQWIAKQISKVTKIPCGKDCLIEPREMGQRGTDIKLYAQAAEMYPFAIEAKNKEQFAINDAIQQAKNNRANGQDWQVFWKKNGMKPVVVMDAATWFDFYERYLNATWR